MSEQRPKRDTMSTEEATFEKIKVFLLLLLLAALILGIASNFLGPTTEIYVLFNPVTLLIIYNVCVYCVIAFLSLRHEDPESWLSLLKDSFKDMVEKVMGTSYSSSLNRHHLEFLAHVSALGLVAGAIAGMYIRGLFMEYRVVWKSTFINSPELVAGLINIVLGPASVLLNGTLLTVDDVKPLLLEHGIIAAPWIHRLALSAFLFVAIPRAYLMIRAGLMIRSGRHPRSSFRFSIRKQANYGNTLSGYVVLEREEARLLFSIEHYLICLDIRKRNEGPEKEKAERWLKDWRESIEQTKSFKIVAESSTLLHSVKKITEDELPREKRKILLFEALLFTPYYKIGAEETKVKADETHLEKGMKDICHKLDCEYDVLLQTKTEFLKALKEIPPRDPWNPLITITLGSAILLALTAGAAAPLIGGLVGSTFLGLSGAAATTAGLALLGGGAIAAGGLGMAGGTLLIVGGGTVLGLGLGIVSQMGSLFEKSPDLTLRELSKMEAILKVLLRRLDNSKDLVSEAISGESAQLMELKSRITRWKLGDLPEGDFDLRKVERSAAIFERAIERLKAL